MLVSLEIPLGIQYGRSERRDLEGRIERDALTMATFAEDTLERGIRTPPPGLVRVARQLPAGSGRARRDRRSEGHRAARHEPSAARAGGRSRAGPRSRPRSRGNIAVGTRYSRTLGTDLVYVAVPVSSGGVVRGAVRITYPTSALDSRVRRYWLLLLAIGGVVLAVATVVGLRFAQDADRAAVGARAGGCRGRRGRSRGAGAGGQRSSGGARARDRVQRHGRAARDAAPLAGRVRRRRVASAEDAARGAATPSREPRARRREGREGRSRRGARGGEAALAAGGRAARARARGRGHAPPGAGRPACSGGRPGRRVVGTAGRA